MEFWSKTSDQLCWKEWPDAMHGIAHLPASRITEVVLLTDEPHVEASGLVTTVRLIRELVGHAVTIIVASPYPSEAWLQPLKEASVDHIWLVARRRCEKLTRGGPDPLREINGSICPALHTGAEAGRTLSVCGCRHDRLVLARHHLKRWCLDAHQSCPHWSEDRGH